MKHIPYDDKLRDCIIVDIDGTLAHMNGKRTPYEYDKVHLDDVNDHLRKLLNIIWRWHWKITVFIITWRKDDCEDETFKWLTLNNIPFDFLYMRNSKDKRQDDIVKEEIYNEHIKWQYNVLAVFEDRNRVVDMWRRNWLFTLQVDYWDF